MLQIFLVEQCFDQLAMNGFGVLSDHGRPSFAPDRGGRPSDHLHNGDVNPGAARVHWLHVQPSPDDLSSLDAKECYSTLLEMAAVAVGTGPLPLGPDDVACYRVRQQRGSKIRYLAGISLPIPAHLLPATEGPIGVDRLFALIVERKAFHKCCQIVPIHCHVQMLDELNWDQTRAQWASCQAPSHAPVLIAWIASFLLRCATRKTCCGIEARRRPPVVRVFHTETYTIAFACPLRSSPAVPLDRTAKLGARKLCAPDKPHSVHFPHPCAGWRRSPAAGGRVNEMASFGLRVRQWRKARDLTQEELARRVGCALSMIQRIESDVRRPSREVAARLAQVLDVAAEERATFLKVARAELAAEHLRPVEAPGVVRNNLPVQRSVLIGRERELADVIALLRRPRSLVCSP